MAKDNHSQSQREAVARYDAKTYRKVNIAFRMEDDADILESMDKAKESGLSLREWIRELYDNQK